MKKEDRKENKLKIVPWWVSIQIYVSNITELVRVLRWSVLPLSPAACPWTDWGGPPGVQPPDRELPSARPPRPPLSQHRFLSPPLSWGGGDHNVRSNQGRMAGKYVIHRLITILSFFFSLIHWPFLYHLEKKKFVWSWPGQQSGLIFVPSLTITSEFLLFKTRSRKIRFQIQGVSIASLGFFLMQARERSSKVGYLGGPRWHRQSLEAFPEK